MSDIYKHRWLTAVLAGVLLAAIAVIHYRVIFSWLPVDPDQLITLSFGTRSFASIFQHQLLEYLPGYRPLFGLSVWLQYRLQGIDHIGFYYLVNLTFLWGIACMVFAVVRHVTGRIDAAIVVAAAMLVDERNHVALIWLDRQISMTAFFGLAALLVLWSGAGKRWSFLAAAVLLLLSVLSKEYGLAYLGLLGIESVRRLLIDRKDHVAGGWLIVAVAVTVTYFAMRYFLANGATGEYCETEGYFWQSAKVCFDRNSGISALPQLLYNIAATFVGTFLPGLFNGDGKLTDFAGISPRYFFYSACFAVFALYSVLRPPYEARLAILLVACNALLSFLLFRHRNHMVGEVGLYIASGIGLAQVLQLCEGARWRRALRFAILAGLALLIAALSYRTEIALAAAYERLRMANFCESVASNRGIDQRLAREIAAKFRPWVPPCQ